jgi:hypothetical protein
MQLYRSEVKPSSEEAVAFRDAYAHPSRAIKFVGVWDTVGALGVPGTAFSYFRRRKYRFHDVELSSSVENAVHALAIDERRRSFAPSVWKRSDKFTGELVVRGRALGRWRGLRLRRTVRRGSRVDGRSRRGVRTRR